MFTIRLFTEIDQELNHNLIIDIQHTGGDKHLFKQNIFSKFEAKFNNYK
jgi:hypothetical protein